MRIFMEHILGPLLGYLVGYLVRWLKRKKFWRKVEATATSYLEDSRIPITDPREAAERALIEAQREPVEQVARHVKKSIPFDFTKSERVPRLGSHAEYDRDPGKSG